MSFLARKKKLLMQSAASVANISYAGNATATASGSPQTLSSVAIGTAAANRYVIVAVALRGTASQADCSAVTVAGTACTQIGTDVNAGTSHLSLWRTNSPIASGTTANIAVTYTNATNIGVAAWAATALLSTTPTDTDSTTTDAASVTSTVSAGGIIVAAAYSVDAMSSATHTWTGVTENFDSLAVTANSSMSGGSANSAVGGNVSVSCNTTGGLGGFMMIAASFR